MTNHQLPQEIKNLQLVISTFESRKSIVSDFSTKVGRLKAMVKEKKNQMKQLPKVG